jgi:hypothetical protein
VELNHLIILLFRYSEKDIHPVGFFEFSGFFITEFNYSIFPEHQTMAFLLYPQVPETLITTPKPAKPEQNKKGFLPQDYLMITWIYIENLV